LVAYKGRTGRFDEVVGRDWCLLTSVDAKADALDASQIAKLQKVGGHVVTVGARNSGADVIDLEGSYQNWFDATGKKHLLVRPDYFVAATASTQDDLRTAFDVATKNLVA
jgi:3-(3-hydroxy-phenyl)propionate hydroxylase